VRLTSRHTFDNHTFTWGGEWREDAVTATNSFGTDLDDEKSTVSSILLQDVWRLGDALTLVLGARWDDSDEWGSQTSPRLNLGWRLSDTLELRLGYGTAFRQPSIGELYYPGSGNPDLEAETSTSYEIGIAAFGRASTSPRFQLNVFDTDIDDMIQFDYATFTNENIGRAEIQGLEATADFPHTSDLVSSLQATWIDAEDGNGEKLLRRADWSGSYTLRGSLMPWLRGDLTVIYVGERDDIDPMTYETVEAESFVTSNLALSAQVWTQIRITVRATNLLDEEYAEVYGYPAPGRRYFAGFRVDL
jgi:outer membrane cobalamin receptor